MGSPSTKPIPQKWTQYIARAARRYATGILAPDDLRQVGAVAYILARQRYIAERGPFEPYAKTAIKNAMIRARQAEQRQHDLPGGLQPVDWGGEFAADPWAEENEAVTRLMDELKARAVGEWKLGLPPKDAIVIDGLFFDDLSQRDVADAMDVSQARISQRKSAILIKARADLAHLKKH